MNSRASRIAAVLVGLVAAGTVLRPLGRRVWEAQCAAQPELRAERLRVAGASGTSLAVLGGFRGLTADLVWLRAYFAWEDRDAAATVAFLKAATAIDPRPLAFWLNGARILAYDVPPWRIEQASAQRALGEAGRRRIAEQQAQQALRYLDEAEIFHPGNPSLWTERAAIEWHARHDLTAAADAYRRAALLPGAPPFAARLRAELLRQVGRRREALDWLISVYSTLPENDETALLLARIRELEHELNIPPDCCYRNPAPPEVTFPCRNPGKL